MTDAEFPEISQTTYDEVLHRPDLADNLTQVINALVQLSAQEDRIKVVATALVYLRDSDRGTRL